MIEVFRHPNDYALESPTWERDGEPYEPGWYYWFLEPCCLPDTEPMGPFETARKALIDARELVEKEP